MVFSILKPSHGIASTHTAGYAIEYGDHGDHGEENEVGDGGQMRG